MTGGRVAIGVDIGGTHLRAARVAADGTVEARSRVPTATATSDTLEICKALITGLLNRNVVGIGIGVPGRVDALNGQVLSGGFVDFSKMDLVAEIGRATGLPVCIENDATMAMLGEARCGAARGQANVVMLTIGTGIGGAVLERGQVLRGRRSAGQLGHIVVVPDGEDCVCGRKGCVEAYSSGTAFARLLRTAGLPPETRAEDLIDHMDNARSRRVIESWARPLRAAIDTLAATFNPDLIVLGGGAGSAAFRALGHVATNPGWFETPVAVATLGDDAGFIGAAMAAFAATPDTAAASKRVVLVNGVPASGKSVVARQLADATGWPILTLDTIKNPFLARLPPSDRAFNRVLGQASYAAIFDLLRDAPDGTTTILDAWFGFQPEQVLVDGLRQAGVRDVAEIWCTAPPDIIGMRYLNRSTSRVPGHPGTEYVPELITLATQAKPMALSPVFPVDTTGPLPRQALTDWLADIWTE